MRLPLLLAACFALAACSAPVPDTNPDPLPEPEAAPSALREAINTPLDKAKAVEATQSDEEAERQKALQEAGG